MSQSVLALPNKGYMFSGDVLPSFGFIITPAMYRSSRYGRLSTISGGLLSYSLVEFRTCRVSQSVDFRKVCLTFVNLYNRTTFVPS